EEEESADELELPDVATETESQPREVAATWKLSMQAPMVRRLLVLCVVVAGIFLVRQAIHSAKAGHVFSFRKTAGGAAEGPVTLGRLTDGPHAGVVQGLLEDSGSVAIFSELADGNKAVAIGLSIAGWQTAVVPVEELNGKTELNLASGGLSVDLTVQNEQV